MDHPQVSPEELDAGDDSKSVSYLHPLPLPLSIFSPFPPRSPSLPLFRSPFPSSSLCVLGHVFSLLLPLFLVSTDFDQVLDGMASGTFVYIAAVDLIVEEMSVAYNATAKFFSIVGGFFTFVILSSHSH